MCCEWVTVVLAGWLAAGRRLCPCTRPSPPPPRLRSRPSSPPTRPPSPPPRPRSSSSARPPALLLLLAVAASTLVDIPPPAAAQVGEGGGREGGRERPAWPLSHLPPACGLPHQAGALRWPPRLSPLLLCLPCLLLRPSLSTGRQQRGLGAACRGSRPWATGPTASWPWVSEVLLPPSLPPPACPPACMAPDLFCCCSFVCLP